MGKKDQELIHVAQDLKLLKVNGLSLLVTQQEKERVERCSETELE